MELKRSGKTIDKIGIGGNSTPTPFDVAQFINDPYGYLQNYHLDLNDFQNIDIRRSMLITQGNPNFNVSTDVIGKWGYFLNVDRSDIGNYEGVCAKPMGTDIVGYWEPNKYIQSNGQKDPLDFNVNGVKNGNLFSSAFPSIFSHQQKPTSTADVCNDYTQIPTAELEFDLNTNVPFGTTVTSFCKGISFRYNGQVPFIRTTIFAPINSPAFVDLTLSSQDPNVIIDFASKQHRTSYGADPLKNSNLSKSQGFILYPTVVENDVLNIFHTSKCYYEIYALAGNLIQKGVLSISQNQLNISELNADIYFVKFMDENNFRETFKFLKK